MSTHTDDRLANIVESLGRSACGLVLKPAKRAELIEEWTAMAQSLPPRSTKQQVWGRTRPQWLAAITALRDLDDFDPPTVRAAVKAGC